jgi:hypothetical protein
MRMNKELLERGISHGLWTQNEARALYLNGLPAGALSRLTFQLILLVLNCFLPAGGPNVRD